MTISELILVILDITMLTVVATVAVLCFPKVMAMIGIAIVMTAVFIIIGIVARSA